MPLKAARAAGQGAQNTLISTASVLTGIELTCAHIGGLTRGYQEPSARSQSQLQPGIQAPLSRDSSWKLVEVGQSRCWRHGPVGGDDLGVGVVIARIAFQGEGNGAQQTFQHRSSAVPALAATFGTSLGPCGEVVIAVLGDVSEEMEITLINCQADKSDEAACHHIP